MSTQIVRRQRSFGLTALCVSIWAAVLLAGVLAGWYGDVATYVAWPIIGSGSPDRPWIPPHALWLVALLAIPAGGCLASRYKPMR